MERYRILPHTADGKFQAFGRTLEEAFGNAALALVSLMWDWSTIEPRIVRTVGVEGMDREQVLVKFLNEVVYLFETRRFLLGRVDRLEIRPRDGGLALDAVLAGEALSPGRELFGGVKAATYHELKIEERDGFIVQVVVDM